MIMESIKNICELPLGFEQGTKSAYQLAKESGFINNDKIDSIIKIKEYLQSHISLVELWELWSQDKRTTEGYYLEIGKKNFVGYHGTKNKSNKVRYKTAIDACSEFIFLEISMLLNL
jgi:hypothetical protein